MCQYQEDVAPAPSAAVDRLVKGTAAALLPVGTSSSRPPPFCATLRNRTAIAVSRYHLCRAFPSTPSGGYLFVNGLRLTD